MEEVCHDLQAYSLPQISFQNESWTHWKFSSKGLSLGFWCSCCWLHCLWMTVVASLFPQSWIHFVWLLPSWWWLIWSTWQKLESPRKQTSECDWIHLQIRLPEMGRCTLNVDSTVPWAPELNTRKKVNWAPALDSTSWPCTMWPVTECSCLMGSPPWWTVPQEVLPSLSHCPWVVWSQHKKP